MYTYINNKRLPYQKHELNMTNELNRGSAITIWFKTSFQHSRQYHWPPPILQTYPDAGTLKCEFNIRESVQFFGHNFSGCGSYELEI